MSAVREHASSLLVAALSTAFGVALLQITGVIATVVGADEGMGSSATVRGLLGVVAIVFIAIATYVGAIVTANTFATIIAGRSRTIALLRLLGATAASQRRAVAREGLLVGLAGAVLGTIAGSAVTFATVTVAVAVDFIPALEFAYLEPVLLIPISGVVLTTWLASWVGSRSVLRVSPMQATGAAQESSLEEVGARRARNGGAIALLVTGTAVLALGVVLGLVTPLGVLVGVVGGMLSFTGIILGATAIMPLALRLVGRTLGTSAAARLAAENAVRYPERSSRTTIGLVIGVTLVTMFAVAAESFQLMIRLAFPDEQAGVDQGIAVTVGIFSVLIGFSALIAAVGMVNNLSLSVLQRTRELGLLRALGFTRGQVRLMIGLESAQLTVTAVVVGLLLGIGYGWAGAQALLGATTGIVIPAVPLWLLAIVAGAAGLLTVAASLVPSRRATRLAPVTAIAVE